MQVRALFSLLLLALLSVMVSYYFLIKNSTTFVGFNNERLQKGARKCTNEAFPGRAHPFRKAISQRTHQVNGSLPAHKMCLFRFGKRFDPVAYDY